jgi:prepilin-type N-terminal cleavage/methylation domain-containing protein
MRNHRHNAGFTIVEVLLAISIVAVLSGLTWASISQMYRTRDLIQERSGRYQAVRITMERLTQEIGSSFIAGPEFGFEEVPGEEATPADAEDPDAPIQAVEPLQSGMIGRDEHIHFTCFAHQRTVEGERAGNVAEIGYFLRSERNEEGDLLSVLMRREDTTLDDNIIRGGTIQRVLPEVESISFEYWDAGEVKLGTNEEIAQGRWVDSWDTTRREFAGRLPTRVRITLVLPPQGMMRSSETFTTQVQIQTTEVMDF